MATELTDDQMALIDSLDNAIWMLLADILEPYILMYDYDGEEIGMVRDAIIEVAERHGVPEMEIYPYIEEEKNNETDD